MWQAAIQSLNAIVLALNGILQVLSSAPAKLPVYAFAALPAPAGLAGQLVYVSDALKPGELPGNGSGLTGYSDGSAWFGTDGTALAV